MALEIYVGGNIDLAIQKLKSRFQKDLSKDVKRHEFYESRSVRRRRKMKMSLRRLKKLEGRSVSRIKEARRLYGKRPIRLDHVGS